MDYKFSILIYRLNHHVKKNEIQYLNNERERQKILDSIDSLINKIKETINLTKNLYTIGQLNRTELFSIQMKHAVLKNKLAEMKMQDAQMKTKLITYDEKQAVLSQERAALYRRMNKYENLHRLECKNKRLRGARIEDIEVEEQISWH